MAKSSIHKDKIFNLFKDGGFKVNLFYKPTMKDNDIFYHIILDSVIKIRLRLINDNIINIVDVIALTSEYLESRYDSLVKTFINQTEFTIIIEKLGNTQSLNNACTKLGLPCVADDRFISIPKKLYNMYTRFYKEDETKFGFYIAAVVDDLDKVEIDEPVIEEPEPEVIIKEVEVIKEVPVEVPVETIKVVEKIVEVDSNKNKVDISSLPIDKQISHILGKGFALTSPFNKENGEFSITYMDIIILTFFMSSTGLEIRDVSIAQNATPPSNIYYMQVFEFIENILEYYSVSIVNIRNEVVYNICKIREYAKIPQVNTNRRSFGSYKVIKYN